MKLESIQLARAVGGENPHVFQDGFLLIALVLSAIVWLLGWYFDTANSMLSIWLRSDTFAHGILIVPISGWLIWRKRHVLATLQPRPNFMALPLLALAGFGWLVAGLGGVGVVQQFSLVIMIPLTVWAILGTDVVRVLAFPLFFLFFAVPFGEFLEPRLMEHTANFTVAALKLSGIPVYREGQYFTIPSGSWSVVEACSGLRYLIASLTLGVLYAYLTYRSVLRRALFIIASVIVPIIANWMRAYMIVMIGHLSSMQYAVGVDHLIYGWLFFGLVMLLLFWAGSYWREDVDGPEKPQSVAFQPVAQPPLAAIMAATIAAAGIVAASSVTASRLEPGDYAAPNLKAPQTAGPWQPLEWGRVSNWKPRFYMNQGEFNQAYTNGKSGVGLWIVYYRHQRPGAQLISTQNTIVSSEDKTWRKTSESRRNMIVGTDEIPSIETTLRGQTTQLLVRRWYWVDGEYVINPYWAKVLQARSRLLKRGDDAAVIIVYALSGEQPPAADQVLQDFLDAMLPSIKRSLENARQRSS